MKTEIAEMLLIIKKCHDLFNASRELPIGDKERKRIGDLYHEKLLSVWNETKTQKEADIAFIKSVEKN